MVADSISQTQRVISIDVLTTSYRVVGKVSVPNTGLTGVINDTMSSHMDILDAKLAKIHMPTKLVEHFEIIRIVKARIFALCLNRREDIGPQALARGGYVRLNEYPVQITSQAFELEGTLEWAGRFDFPSIMVEGSRDFIPLYNGVLSAILIPALKIESPAILFNRKQTDLLGLKTQRQEQ